MRATSCSCPCVCARIIVCLSVHLSLYVRVCKCANRLSNRPLARLPASLLGSVGSTSIGGRSRGPRRAPSIASRQGPTLRSGSNAAASSTSRVKQARQRPPPRCFGSGLTLRADRPPCSGSDRCRRWCYLLSPTDAAQPGARSMTRSLRSYSRTSLRPGQMRHWFSSGGHGRHYAA